MGEPQEPQFEESLLETTFRRGIKEISDAIQHGYIPDRSPSFITVGSRQKILGMVAKLLDEIDDIKARA